MRKKWKLLWIAVVCVFVINSYLEKDGTENGICVAYAEDMTSDNERIGAQDLSGTAASFQIDNEHLYDEMNETYSNGYVPKVENGYVTMVLPLLCDQRLKDGKLTASLDLGAAENSPFVLKNYEKQVRYTECTVNGGEEKVEAYPVIFSVELRGDRINGSYPVTINIRGNDISGMK